MVKCFVKLILYFIHTINAVEIQDPYNLGSAGKQEKKTRLAVRHLR